MDYGYQFDDHCYAWLAARLEEFCRNHEVHLLLY